MQEANLSACNAIESSLWEIRTLQSHALPEIAYSAKFIDRELPKTEWDISQYLEMTMEDVKQPFLYILVSYPKCHYFTKLLEKELKRKNSEEDVPLNFEKPAKFACIRHDKFVNYFEIPDV